MAHVQRSENNCILTIHPVGPGDQTQVVSLGSKSLYPQSPSLLSFLNQRPETSGNSSQQLPPKYSSKWPKKSTSNVFDIVQVWLFGFRDVGGELLGLGHPRQESPLSSEVSTKYHTPLDKHILCKLKQGRKRVNPPKRDSWRQNGRQEVSPEYHLHMGCSRQHS